MKNYIDPSYKKGTKIKVTNKNDDDYGKKGIVVTQGRGKKKGLHVIEFPDGQRGTFNWDEFDVIKEGYGKSGIKQLKKDYADLKKNEPRIVKFEDKNENTTVWEVQIYSNTTKGYITVAEYTNPKTARADLKNFQKDHKETLDKIMKLTKDGIKESETIEEGDRMAYIGQSLPKGNLRFVITKRIVSATSHQDPYRMYVLDNNHTIVKDWGSHPTARGAVKFGKSKGFKFTKNPIIEMIEEGGNFKTLKEAKKDPFKSSKFVQSLNRDLKDVDDKIKDIEKELKDPSLSKYHKIMKSTRKALLTQKTLLTSMLKNEGFKKGDKVRIVNPNKNDKLDGAVGTVRQEVGKEVIIDFDKPVAGKITFTTRPSKQVIKESELNELTGVFGTLEALTQLFQTVALLSNPKARRAAKRAEKEMYLKKIANKLLKAPKAKEVMLRNNEKEIDKFMKDNLSSSEYQKSRKLLRKISTEVVKQSPIDEAKQLVITSQLLTSKVIPMAYEKIQNELDTLQKDGKIDKAKLVKSLSKEIPKDSFRIEDFKSSDEKTQIRVTIYAIDDNDKKIIKKKVFTTKKQSPKNEMIEERMFDSMVDGVVSVFDNSDLKKFAKLQTVPKMASYYNGLDRSEKNDFKKMLLRQYNKGLDKNVKKFADFLFKRKKNESVKNEFWDGHSLEIKDHDHIENSNLSPSIGDEKGKGVLAKSQRKTGGRKTSSVGDDETQLSIDHAHKQVDSRKTSSVGDNETEVSIDYAQKQSNEGIDVLSMMKQTMSEGKKDYEIYHKSYSAAVEEMLKFIDKNGYDLDLDGDFFSQVSTGGKPSVGKTKRHNIPLTKNGKETRRRVVFQVYGMPKGSYELNMYIT
jgi:hypothetical protein